VSLPTIGLLVLILILSTGEMIHGQLLKLGEQFFGDVAGDCAHFNASVPHRLICTSEQPADVLLVIANP
jgi:hypothetical protein